MAQTLTLHLAADDVRAAIALYARARFGHGCTAADVGLYVETETNELVALVGYTMPDAAEAEQAMQRAGARR